MTYAETVKRYMDLLDRVADMIEQADWDDPEDPDEEEFEDDESTATPVYAITGGKAS